MGVADSTAYQPLKEALCILHGQKDSDLALLYFASYFMGDIHEKNGNRDIARQYFQKALMCAKQRDDMPHVFDAYLSLFYEIRSILIKEGILPDNE